jgi:hypothetical protein
MTIKQQIRKATGIKGGRIQVNDHGCGNISANFFFKNTEANRKKHGDSINSTGQIALSIYNIQDIINS